MYKQYNKIIYNKIIIIKKNKTLILWYVSLKKKKHSQYHNLCDKNKIWSPETTIIPIFHSQNSSKQIFESNSII